MSEALDDIGVNECYALGITQRAYPISQSVIRPTTEPNMPAGPPAFGPLAPPLRVVVGDAVAVAAVVGDAVPAVPVVDAAVWVPVWVPPELDVAPETTYRQAVNSSLRGLIVNN